jgi:predicted enzyme related to lactoylglutathione lyase
VVASIVPIGDDQPDVRPHWGVTFAVDDADAIAEKAAEGDRALIRPHSLLGGKVIVSPMDAPWVRTTVIADPQGAIFTASKYVPENRDLATEADTTSAS